MLTAKFNVKAQTAEVCPLCEPYVAAHQSCQMDYGLYRCAFGENVGHKLFRSDGTWWKRNNQAACDELADLGETTVETTTFPIIFLGAPGSENGGTTASP